MLRLALSDAEPAFAAEITQAAKRLRDLTILDTAEPAGFKDCDAILLAGPPQSWMAALDRADVRDQAILLWHPFAASREQLEPIIARCRAVRSVLFPGFLLRYRPSNAAVKTALDAGQLGLPGLLRAHHWQPAQPLGSSRVLITQLLDLAVWMFGRTPTQLFATAGGTRDDSPWPDHVQVHLGFPDDGMALLSAKYGLPGGTGYATVSLIGSRGAAYADDQSQMQVVYRDARPAARHDAERIPTLVTLLKEFQHAVKERRDPVAVFSSLQTVLSLTDHVQTSLEVRQSISLKGQSP